MNDDVKAYLDGELELDALAPADREDALMWSRALAELRESDAETAPAWLEDSIMAEVESLGPRTVDVGPSASAVGTSDTAAASSGRDHVHWLRRPFTVRVTPLSGLLAAAALAAIALIPRSGAETGAGAGVAPQGVEGVTTVYVQFLFEAPGARSVAVAGDFNEWEGRHTLEDPDGDGVWTGRVPLQPGMHQYMFVIDGADWITDPNALHYADDGFGGRNAVVAVESPLGVTNS